MLTLIIILLLIIVGLISYIIYYSDDYETGRIYYKSEEIAAVDNDQTPHITKKIYHLHCVITNEFGGTKDRKVTVAKDLYEAFKVGDIIPIK